MDSKFKRDVFKILYHFIVIIIGFFMLYPIFWMILASFKENSDIVSNSYQLLPKEFKPDNYIRGWKGFGGISFATFFKNSFIITISATLATAISSAVVAYGFARIRFPLKKYLFGIMLMTLMLPSQVIIVPQYIIFQKLDWVNTFAPLIVPSLFANAFFIFLMMQFIQGLPIELDEAAIIDGCNIYTVFTRIILPMMKPAVVTTLIIQFYWKWDEFMGPLLYLGDPKKYPVSLAIKAFSDSTSVTDYGAIFSMSTLSLIPVFFIFLFFNRYLIEGVSTTGLKA